MISLAITLAAKELPLAELMLQHLGALSTTIAEPQNYDSPIYEPPIDSHPIWPQARLIAHFEELKNVERIENSLKNLLQHNVSVTTEVLTETDWQSAYQRHFNPQVIDQQLYVYAPWHEVDRSYPYRFIINPGIAFGTGTHPTTRLCLQWMVQNQTPATKEVLDFGCGSGILSLCAHVLNYPQVTAIDIDPQAISATQSNIKLNGFALDAFHVQTDVPERKQQFGLILANILYTPLVELRDKFDQWLEKDGQLVVSGLLASQVEAIIDHYQAHFHYQTQAILDDWALVHFSARR